MLHLKKFTRFFRAVLDGFKFDEKFPSLLEKINLNIFFLLFYVTHKKYCEVTYVEQIRKNFPFNPLQK